LTAHSGNLLKHHPVDRFGCTICHQGQGRATDKDGAHGRVPFWDQPLLAGDLVQATCNKCHHEVDVPEAPVLARGQRLLSDLGCAGCHQLGQGAESEKAGPSLSRTGSKISRKWLEGWLANPKSYLPAAKMPRYVLNSDAVQALSAYLMTFRDPAIDSLPEPAGDPDAGKTIYREAQCIVCHITKEDARGNPVGGTIGLDLRKIGNKVNERWLAEFLTASSRTRRCLPRTSPRSRRRTCPNLQWKIGLISTYKTNKRKNLSHHPIPPRSSGSENFCSKSSAARDATI
jgi:cytochrome c2